MSDFYVGMSGMVKDVLSPTSLGGLGQGNISLVHIETGSPDPLEPWKPVVGTETTQSLRGASKGIDSSMIGVDVGGTVLLSSDKEVISEVPAITYLAGDKIIIDGQELTIISAENIPAAGTPCAVRFIVRG